MTRVTDAAAWLRVTPPSEQPSALVPHMRQRFDLTLAEAVAAITQSHRRPAAPSAPEATRVAATSRNALEPSETHRQSASQQGGRVHPHNRVSPEGAPSEQPTPAAAPPPATIDGAVELACMMTLIGMALRCARAAAPEVLEAEVRGFRAWASASLARGDFTPGQRNALQGALRMVEGELNAKWPTAVRAVEGDTP